MNKVFLTLFSILLLADFLNPVAGLAQSARVRTIDDFDSGWRFLKGDAQGAEQVGFGDAAWRSLSVPHDWAIEGPFDAKAVSGQGGAFLPTGIGWYRKSFTLPSSAEHRHVFIAFDGVMANSDVWVNGFHLGHRPYGYVSFFYDMSGHVNFGPKAVNVIAVKCDTSKQPASRWYAGSGIYRPVRLVTVNEVHTDPWSFVVTTPKVSATTATVHLETTVVNETTATAQASVMFSVTGSDGHVLKVPATATKNIPTKAGVRYSADVEVASPAVWDIDHPVMYQAVAEVQMGGKTVDDDAVAFGIREFHFDAATGFWMNGRNFKLKGAALHGDLSSFGVAAPIAAWERRLTELRALGVNAIRTAHNPPSPEFLDLCDRMGFLVMDEFFDCWTVGKNPFDYHLYFQEWATRDERDTIRRDRNHPSVILWSVGNEIHDTPQEALAHKILTALVAVAHENDLTRPVTQALFRPNVSHDYDNGLADLLDVVGQNYRENELLAAHAQKPTRKILGTENTHDRNQWIAMRDHPEYSGQFLWVGADYLGESGVWPLIANGAGLLDRTGGVAARGYERQSWWSGTPNVHIARRISATEKTAVDPGYESVPPKFLQSLYLDWTPKNQAAHVENIEVYSNAEEVELTLNGTSLGKQKLHPDASPMTWKVPYAAGTLRAVAYTGGKQVASDELRTAGKAARVRLTAERSAMTASSDDAVYLDADVVDEKGAVVPDASNLLKFSVSGGAKVLNVDDASNVDHDPFQAESRRVYEGRAIVVVGATQTGAITVTATSPGLVDGTAKVTVATAAGPVSARSF